MPKNPSTTQLAAYLVPKQLPVIMAKVVRYKASPCLAVFQDKNTKQIDIVEVPL
jgi:hypothetical protein